jgi:predicted permease
MLNDLRYALRTLRRSPGFAASAILALALGIGANTAVFSIIYAVILKPLPYDEPDRLVRLYETNRGQSLERGPLSPGTFLDWQARSRAFDSLAVFSVPGEALWSFRDGYEVVRLSRVSPSLFQVLRTSPVLGRVFAPDAAPPSTPEVVIGYGLWQRRFGGRGDIIGENVSIEGRVPARIIGVMPRGFEFPGSADAWANVGLRGPVPPARRSQRFFAGIGRIAAGQSVESARHELAGISAQLEREHADSNRGWTADLEPLAAALVSVNKAALFTLLGAVSGVLLIGCANVANLLLARATARQHEMSVRLALGAGTARLLRQCFTEALTLCFLGTVAGLLVGHWMTRVLVRMAPPEPRLNEAGMNAALLLFAIGACLASTVLVGVIPALQSARATRAGALRLQARGMAGSGGTLRRLLIAGEVTVVVLLLTTAVLFARSFVRLRGVDLGFAPRQVLSVETRWPVGRFPPSPAARPWPRVQRAVDELIAAIQSVPGVEAAGLMTDLPLTGEPFSASVWRADAPGASGLTAPPAPRDRWKADLSIVTAGYFPAMSIRFVRGRNFIDADRFSEAQLNNAAAPRAGVAVINAAFASRYFPDADPIGQTVVLSEDQTFGSSRTIVGVVSDVRGRKVAEEPRPVIFLPHAQHPDVFRPAIAIRSSLPPDAIVGAIRERIRAFDSQLLVMRTRPMDEIVSGALSRPRFNLLLIGSFALIALGLAAVGIYGVVAFLVTQRTREIGIRMALGARAGDVLRLVFRDGLAPVVLGGAVGMIAAFAATRGIRSMLFGVTPLDPVSFAAAPALLAAVALLACYLPARRATRVDPLVALRDE